MATVYLAEDLKHGRNVALKILRPELAAVIGAERFVAEIKTTANLQHPHILPLFDSGEADGFLYYVMPFIDGETLRERIEREQQLGVDEAVRIARDVADALDYAHRNDIIHRDIKPANILLHDGRPVVADFGIALAISAAGGGRMTETGLSLGTPHYMSPEQASADRDLTARSDVYSLGCVLYEMLAGQPPHTGPSAQSILVRILTEDPRPLSDLRRTVPPNVSAAVMKSIEKLPADRFDTAKAFMEALDDAAFAYVPAVRETTAAAAVPSPPASSSARLLPWAMAAVFAGFAAWGWLRPAPQVPPEPATRAVVELGEVGLRFNDRIIISPEGSTLAMVGVQGGRQGLYVRNADEESFRLLVGSGEPQYPSFSPDGNWIVYEDDADNSLMKAAISGGAPRPVVPPGDAGYTHPHWGDDGTIVFRGIGGGVYRVPDTGGEPTLLTDRSFANPRLLPGGRAVLLTQTGAGPSVYVLDLEADTIRELVPGGVDARYLSTGHLAYADQAGTLWVTDFDLEAGELRGEPRPVLEGVRLVQGGARARFSVSENGTLVSTRGGTSSLDAANSHQMLIVGLDGEERVLPLTPRPMRNFRWSPDGESVAYSGSEPGGSMLGRMIYVYNVALGTTPRQLTFEGSNHDPHWSPDGSAIVFASDRGGSARRDLFVVSVLDDSPPELLLGKSARLTPRDWSTDDHVLFDYSAADFQGTDIWMMDPSDSSTARPFLEAEALQTRPQVSPAGDLVAYQSFEGGGEVAEVYVRSFPEPRQPVIVSSGGGRSPLWSPAGDRIYYWKVGGLDVSIPDSLFVGHVQREPTFSVVSTEFVLAGTYEAQGSWDLHPDGDRFVVARVVQLGQSTEDDAVEAERHLIVTNWFTELLAAVGEGN
jgi:serine/threonine-protein kinase